MRTSLLALTLAVLCAPPALAQHDGHAMPPPATAAAATAWTNLPLVAVRPQGPAGAEIAVANSAAAEITVTPTKGETRTLALDAGKAKVKPAVGNYHLIQAVEGCDSHVATASTAVYFSNPGPAPTDLLEQGIGAGLTVLPQQLPREHGAWRSGDTVRFVVRFDGTPFPGARVRFDTANGSHSELRSDIDGSVDLVLPDDFPPRDQRPPEAHGRPTQAQFVIAAIEKSGAVQNIGAFNYTYRPNAYDGTSLWTGVGFAALGMVSAAPLLRRRKTGERA